MTREELFSTFKLPFRLSDETQAVIVDADGFEILMVDPFSNSEPEDQDALAALIVELLNGCEE